MKADSIMTRDVVCIEADDSLADAHQIMLEWEIRHLPVLDGKRLVGVLSNRDVLAFGSRTEQGLDVPNIPVVAAMTHEPLTCRATSELAAIGATMIRHKIDCLPVVDDDGELVGMVTSSDLIEILIAKEPSLARRTALPFQFTVHAGMRPGMARPAAL